MPYFTAQTEKNTFTSVSFENSELLELEKLITSAAGGKLNYLQIVTRDGEVILGNEILKTTEFVIYK